MKLSELPPCPFCKNKFIAIPWKNSDKENHIKCITENLHKKGENNYAWAWATAEQDPVFITFNIRWDNKHLSFMFDSRTMDVSNIPSKEIQLENSLSLNFILPIESILDLEALKQKIKIWSVFQ